LDVAAVVDGGKAPIDAMSWHPELGSQLLILARDDGREVARVAVEPRYSLHSINSFEEQGMLHVDLIEYDRPVYPEYQPLPELFAEVPPGEPVRYTIEMQNRRIQRKRTIPYRNAADFPAINPKRLARHYDDFWMLGISTTGRAGAKFFDQLVHLNWEADAAPDVYCPAKGRFLAGEPTCVANPRCDSESVILCHEFDPAQAQSWFLVFDAYAVSNGPIARLQLDDLAPPGFHAAFVPTRCAGAQ
jgi:carotenoid cleavage dioxygenase-like enzyme